MFYNHATVIWTN